nr:MAG TPA: hypothetical protein [Caudoviricetes sp.]
MYWRRVHKIKFKRLDMTEAWSRLLPGVQPLFLQTGVTGHFTV